MLGDVVGEPLAGDRLNHSPEDNVACVVVHEPFFICKPPVDRAADVPVEVALAAERDRCDQCCRTAVGRHSRRVREEFGNRNRLTRSIREVVDVRRHRVVECEVIPVDELCNGKRGDRLGTGADGKQRLGGRRSVGGQVPRPEPVRIAQAVTLDDSERRTGNRVGHEPIGHERFDSSGAVGG